jgi:hypothetical protein
LAVKDEHNITLKDTRQNSFFFNPEIYIINQDIYERVVYFRDISRYMFRTKIFLIFGSSGSGPDPLGEGGWA